MNARGKRGAGRWSPADIDQHINISIMSDIKSRAILSASKASKPPQKAQTDVITIVWRDIPVTMVTGCMVVHIKLNAPKQSSDAVPRKISGTACMDAVPECVLQRRV